MALAKVLTTCLHLPSSPVEDISQFFRIHCQISTETMLNQVNEIMVVDTKYTLDLVRKFYNLRYNSVHPVCHVFAFSKDSAVEDFFGISRDFDKVSLDVIKNSPNELTNYVNLFKKMVDELKS